MRYFQKLVSFTSSVYALAFVFCIAASAAEKPAPKEFFPALPDGQKFQLVWNDEFDGEKLDETKWEVPENQRRDGWWSSKAISLDGKGKLVMSTLKDGDKFLDGCVRTRGKFEHSFGYYVIRAKLHSQQGHWPAFWLYNGSVGNIGNGGVDGAEIDIFEKPSLDFRVNHAIHWDGYGEYHKQVSTQSYTAGIMKGYHTYALLWTPEEYAFFIDGNVVWKTTGGGICREPLYIKISDEIGNWAGDINKAALPDSFLVDYVRVYDVVKQ
jgi:beta-glucanase (GH16 family)